MKYPNIQYHFLPFAVRYDGKAAAEGHGFQTHVGPMRSKSRGRVRLTSPEPAAAPSILFNYMSHEEDWQTFRACIRLTREILSQPALADYTGEEIAPGAAVQSDDEIDDFVKGAVESAYHPCGTCRMGAADDADAVVDPPAASSAWTGCAWRTAPHLPPHHQRQSQRALHHGGREGVDHILGRAPLPPANDVPWVHPDWENRQR